MTVPSMDDKQKNDTDIKPRYSDEFVTIQTCLDAYSSKRVVLLAVKVKEYPIQED